MKIVLPYAKIISPESAENALSFIEAAARISHRSEELQTETSYERFIRAVVLERGDWSVAEHVSVTVEFLVDRGITHELVRHRLFSYTQESTRFVNYEKKMPPSFIYPIVGVECPECLNGYEAKLFVAAIDEDNNNITLRAEHVGGICCFYNLEWLTAITSSENMYKKLLAGGWRPQEARSVFPNALASKIWMTGNLRNWRHFFQMRTSKEAHPQMRQVTIPLLKEFQEKFSILFEDVVPDEAQSKAIRKGR